MLRLSKTYLLPLALAVPATAFAAPGEQGGARTAPAEAPPAHLVMQDSVPQPALKMRLTVLRSEQAQLSDDEVAALQRIYAARDWQPLWWQDGRWSPRAMAALNAIASAGTEGLPPATLLPQFHLPQIGGLYASVPTRSGMDPRVAGDELRLSAAMLRYVRAIRGGLVDPNDLRDHWFPDMQDVDAAGLLQQGLDSPDFATWLKEDLPPDNPDYHAMRERLAELRTLEAEGGLPRLDHRGLLRVGSTGPAVEVVRRQLKVLGDLPDDAITSEAATYDKALAEAVKSFQRRQGLSVDGVVGPNTRKTLNSRVADGIRTVVVNMERLRWNNRRPDPNPERYVHVNIPSFTLQAYEGGSVALEMPVVVGRTKRQTPIMDDAVRSLVTWPTWTVPRSIARKDIVPKLRSDPSYLSRHNMSVYSSWQSGARRVNPHSIDWSRVDGGSMPYMIRQNSGRGSALGVMRFSLGNPFAIYLHDTPKKYLFKRSYRAKSSGCVRVGDWDALRDFILRGGNEDKRGIVQANMSKHRHGWVNMPEDVPVRITYYTAWIDDNGVLQVRDDLYGHDRELAAMLGLDRLDDQPADELLMASLETAAGGEAEAVDDAGGSSEISDSPTANIKD